MGSKGIAVFGTFFAIVLLVSSEVEVRKLAETFNTCKASKEYSCGLPGCCQLYGSYCQYCCTYAGEKEDAEAQAKPHN
ncbi:hypothetical protein CDL12_10998 [Handroanthus impetiginosus]|uniref:Uncharacterized protein n=1 Tax=Handroanthus impetiginosus TaxID=429701 RepID=A0A2G9HFR4_9LAMI|nr:hypothetical protein CDL12_10998 [Handroanthus impetiginosus]